MEPQVVLHIGPLVPAMTYEKFAEAIGVSPDWVADRVERGELPRLPKKGREKPLINVAKYWQDVLSQPY